ncbi:MAG: TA system VapC family ribonuclease toxin [Gemmatimonadota bacterium]
MIAVDTNILVYAHREESRKHRAARVRLEELATGSAQWGLPVYCIHEFVRIVTHPRVFYPPTSLDEALAALDALLESPTLMVLHPGNRWWTLFRRLASEGGAGGNLVFDAAIAAVCQERGARTILTENRDFSRFDSPVPEAL